MTFFNFPHLYNHSLPPFLDLLTAECTIDAKVDHPTNYSHLLRLSEGTKVDLQPN